MTSHNSHRSQKNVVQKTWCHPFSNFSIITIQRTQAFPAFHVSHLHLLNLQLPMLSTFIDLIVFVTIFSMTHRDPNKNWDGYNFIPLDTNCPLSSSFLGSQFHWYCRLDIHLSWGISDFELGIGSFQWRTRVQPHAFTQTLSHDPPGLFTFPFLAGRIHPYHSISYQGLSPKASCINQIPRHTCTDLGILKRKSLAKRSGCLKVKQNWMELFFF